MMNWMLVSAMYVAMQQLLLVCENWHHSTAYIKYAVARTQCIEQDADEDLVGMEGLH
jgi:hypothetical protein